MSITRKTVAIGGALAAAMMITGAANAQSYYVKGFGGWTIPQDDDFQLNDRGTGANVESGFNFDTGYAVGAAVGYDFSPTLALEAEYVYRNADTRVRNIGTDEKGSTASNAWMVNALYKFQPLGATGAFHPYAGAGIGMADLSVDDVGQKLDSDYKFSYQIIGGVGYDIAPQFQLYTEARYFMISDQKIENDDVSFDTTYGTFDVLFGASYRF